jgi:N-acetylglucosaminyldiphosphoundecaprenol N-acetyl-beta-D-mannosaminyltransferase
MDDSDQDPLGSETHTMTLQKLPSYALMGLPVHALSQAETVGQLWQAVRAHRPLVLTTPNLNFVVACRSDRAFRQSVLRSDLVVADGMPLVWVARLLGIPIPERVAGSSVFEAIRTSPPPDNGQRMRVFFFGGQPGVAQRAHERVNTGSLGMESVGFLDPGFGSVAKMSSDAIIETLNAADPDFLVIALGAAKGQAWIERNRQRLNARVISHLGAVINFSAGSVQRSPLWMQGLGLEWLWRIKEEPQLWRRYRHDAQALGGMVLRELLPLWLFKRSRFLLAPRELASEVRLRRDRCEVVLMLGGDSTARARPQLDKCIDKVLAARTPLRVDFGKVRHIDEALLASLMRLLGARRALGLPVTFTGASVGLMRLLRWQGAWWLLDEAAASERVSGQA